MSAPTAVWRTSLSASRSAATGRVEVEGRLERPGADRACRVVEGAHQQLPGRLGGTSGRTFADLVNQYLQAAAANILERSAQAGLRRQERGGLVQVGQGGE